MPVVPFTISPEEPAARLAINLADVLRINSTIRGMLFGGKLHEEPARLIRMDLNSPDETAVEFRCDLLTAAAVCDTVRSHDRAAGDHPTRVYLFRRSWSKLPGAAVLTRVVGGKMVLEAGLFPLAAKTVIAPAVAIEARRVV